MFKICSSKPSGAPNAKRRNNKTKNSRSKISVNSIIWSIQYSDSSPTPIYQGCRLTVSSYTTTAPDRLPLRISLRRGSGRQASSTGCSEGKAFPLINLIIKNPLSVSELFLTIPKLPYFPHFNSQGSSPIFCKAVLNSSPVK